MSIANLIKNWFKKPKEWFFVYNPSTCYYKLYGVYRNKTELIIKEGYATQGAIIKIPRKTKIINSFYDSSTTQNLVS
jgi:hypothetical protein